MTYLKCLLGVPIAFVVAQGLRVESTPYATVTDERLQRPEASDWLMYRRTYDGSGYSPLQRINTSNVGKLSLAWSLSTDLIEAHETTPIVNRGRMFITTPGNNVIALNAKTGTQLWRYVKKYPDGLFQLHPTNRGVALYGNRVYMATTDCQLVALDAATGKEDWSVPIVDYKTGCYAMLAPLAARGKILVGYSGGEFGVRGSGSAFDADTGKRLWRTYTVPAPEEPGGATWKGDTYKSGGGSIWITGVFDPASNITTGVLEIRHRGLPPKGDVPKSDAAGFYVGYQAESIFGSVRTSAGAADHLGELQAWDLNTGRRVWQHNFKTILWAPLLVPGGDVVFAGGTPDREFRAFHARTGNQLWSFPAPAGVIGVPTSFEVDGEQVHSCHAGWGLDAQDTQNGIDRVRGTTTVVPKAGTLLVFKLR